jgi:hypothetical protein
VSDLREELSVYSNERISYASRPQRLTTEALMEIKELDKRLAELEADKAELLDALDIVWDSITDWRGDDWVICLMAKHQQPTKETQQ